MSWDCEELTYLRWHYGSVYRINGSDDHWTATRDGQTLTASSALALLDAIRDDYRARPGVDVVRVMRKLAG